MIKRLSKLLSIVFVFTLFAFTSCKAEEYHIDYSKDFSVHFLDCGTNEAIFIHFPDGKNMMIDCAGKKDFSFIQKTLDVYGVKTIDYLILTKPDVNNVGGVKNIINHYDVGKVFLPRLLNKENFNFFFEITSLIEQKQIDTAWSETYSSVTAEDYGFMFLHPNDYDDFNGKQYPTVDDINNSSCVLYLECFNRRFLFGGDVGFDVENEIVSKYRIGLYSYGAIGIDLDNIDFLKVSRNGKDSATGNNILSVLKPKRAMIFTTAYDVVSSEVIERIYDSNLNCMIYRSDVYGTVSAFVNSAGEMRIKTQR